MKNKDIGKAIDDAIGASVSEIPDETCAEVTRVLDAVYKLSSYKHEYSILKTNFIKYSERYDRQELDRMYQRIHVLHLAIKDLEDEIDASDD